MKQLTQMTFFFLLILTTLCAGTALADHIQAEYADQPPAEVLLHIGVNYLDDLLEDYIAITGMSQGDYGFALLSHGEHRMLVGYREKDGAMTYWFRSEDAVPQGDGYAFFRRHTAGECVSYGNTSATYSNDLGFDVIRIDKEHEEYWSQLVGYHWRSGIFRLDTYMDIDDSLEHAYVTDTAVRFYNPSTVRKLGSVSGTVQRDIRYVSFPALPKSYAEARQKLTVAPEIPYGELSAENIKFTGGRRYEVYTAPSETSLRAGSGKAAVSTNDWIQVFGAEDGFILIQYAIDRDQMRFGYIDEASLPTSASVQTLRWRNTAATLTERTTLTDDPLNSRLPLLTLPKGSSVTLLGTMGDWAYVETTAGTWVRGFVPEDALSIVQEEDVPAAGSKAV